MTLLEEQSAFSGQASVEDVKKIIVTENSKDRKTYRCELFQISQLHNHTLRFVGRIGWRLQTGLI